MKILLIVPPYRTTDKLTKQLYPMPLGLVYIGTELQQYGHTVIIKDFLLPAEASRATAPGSFNKMGSPGYVHYGMPMDWCKAWLKRNLKNYDVVGLAMGQCNIYEAAAELGRHIKAHGKPLVIGGPFVTTATEEALSLTGADVAVVGEGEVVADEAFRNAKAGKRGIIKGVPQTTDAFGELDWNLAPQKNYPKYNGKVRGVLTVSRGCPWACSFCSVHTVMGKQHRRQNRAQIERQLKRLHFSGVRYICFLDDNLFINERAVDDVLYAIRAVEATTPKFKRVRFYMEEGMEVRMAAKPGIVQRIKDARFDNIALGVETLNENRLASVNKPYDRSMLKAAIANCKAAGVIPRAFYIIGFPGDTIQSVVKDIIGLANLGVAVRANNLKLYPGTPMTKKFVEEGWVPKDYDWRLSSFYTPCSGTLTMREIKKLKTFLGAVGTLAAEHGINPFTDTLEDIERKLGHSKRGMVWQDGTVELQGKMFRPTPYRYLTELLVIRYSSGGAASTIKEIAGKQKRITAVPMNAYKDNVQQAIASILRNPRINIRLPKELFTVGV